MEIDRKLDSFIKITLHQLLHHNNIPLDKNEINNLLLTELESFQEYCKGKYTNFDLNLLQPDCNIDELAENNVENLNISRYSISQSFRL